MFDFFHERAVRRADSKNRKGRDIEYNGLGAGFDFFELYADFDALGRDPIKMFGKPWVELPKWLKADLLLGIAFDDWHDRNLEAPDPGKVQESYNPFKTD